MRPRRERRSLSEQIVQGKSSQVKSRQSLPASSNVTPCPWPLQSLESCGVRRSPRAEKQTTLRTEYCTSPCTTIVQDVDV